MEHFGLLLPKGRSHHTGAGEGRRSSAETGRGAGRDPEQAISPRPSLRLPVAVPVRQAGRAVRRPTACCAEKRRADIVLHHRCPRDPAAAANMAYSGLEGSKQFLIIIFFIIIVKKKEILLTKCMYLNLCQL